MSDITRVPEPPSATSELRMLHAIVDGIHVVYSLRALCVAVIIVICAVAENARAGCEVALGGDAAIVERIRAELTSFAEDGAPCLALWVQCRRNFDQLEIDLRDDLGRASQRSFDSAAGAAAFIVSWSRRPLMADLVSIAPPGDGPPRDTGPPGASVASPAAAGSGSQDQRWHPELGASMVTASGAEPVWGAITGALVQRTAIWRYGGAARVMMGGHVGHVITQVEGELGAVHALSSGLVAVGALIAGSTISGTAQDGDSVGYGAVGFRIGVRATVDQAISASLGLELGVGYDVVWSDNFNHAGFGHLDFGLRWVP